MCVMPATYSSNATFRSLLLLILYKNLSVGNRESCVLSFTSQFSKWKGNFISTLFHNVEYDVILCTTCNSFVLSQYFLDSSLYLSLQSMHNLIPDPSILKITQFKIYYSIYHFLCCFMLQHHIGMPLVGVLSFKDHDILPITHQHTGMLIKAKVTYK